MGANLSYGVDEYSVGAHGRAPSTRHHETRRSTKSPLPAGEGWVREKLPQPPTPGHHRETKKPPLSKGRRKAPLSQKGGWGDLYLHLHPHLELPPPPHPVIPARHRHSCPPPSFPLSRESTPRPTATPKATGVLDSGLRRNDGGGLPSPGSNATKKPPLSQKGGWGDLYLYLHLHPHPHPELPPPHPVIPAKAGIHPPGVPNGGAPSLRRWRI